MCRNLQKSVTMDTGHSGQNIKMECPKVLDWRCAQLQRYLEPKGPKTRRLGAYL